MRKLVESARQGLQTRLPAQSMADGHPRGSNREGSLREENALLQAKVDMLRDNLRAARLDAADKARLEAEVARLKERLRSGNMAQHSGEVKKGRSISEDELGSQTQLWMQLDALQKENSRLADANHALSAQLSHASLQRAEAQAKWTKWAERENALKRELASAQALASQSAGKGQAEEEVESLQQTNKLLTDQIRTLQAKADASRQTVEEISAENTQLAAHVQLLESELEVAQRRGGIGQHPGGTESTEGSPRSSQHPSPLHEGQSSRLAPEQPAQHNGGQPDAEPVKEASPGFALKENPAFDREAVADPPSGLESDFQFSSLKRKWLEEEGKFLSGKLRRAQDLCVQQEMELESLRQQVAALSRLLSQEREAGAEQRGDAAPAPQHMGLTPSQAALEEEVAQLRAEAERANAAEALLDGLHTEVDTLRRQIEGLQSQAGRVEELEQEVQLLRASAARVPDLKACLEQERASAPEHRRQLSEGASNISGEAPSAGTHAEELLLELENSRAEAAKVPGLQQELNEAESRAAAAAEELAAAAASTSRVAALEADLEAARALAQQARSSLEEAQGLLSKRDADLAQAEAALAERGRSSAADAEARAVVEGRLARLHEELRQARAASESSAAQAAASTWAHEAEDIAGQLAAAQADAAALKQSLDAAVARADGHYNAVQQMNAQVQEAQQTCIMLAEDKERLQGELAKMEAAHNSERNGLKEKLERLQKANKQRRHEIEEMQGKLSSMHQRAAAYDQTSQELQQLRKQYAEVKPLADAHGQLQEELQACRGELRDAEKRITSFDALARKAASVFEARLGVAERERDQLLEQVAVLKSAAVANEALTAQAAAAQRELSAAQEAVRAAAELQARAEAAERSAADARADAQAAQATIAVLEERLRTAEEDAHRIAGAVEDERERRASAARVHANELEALPTKPPSAWPAPVRTLVRAREATAAEAAAAAVRQEATSAEAALEAELETVRSARRRTEAQLQEATLARERAEADTAAVSRELAEREDCLGKQLDAARAQADAAAAEHAAAVDELRRQLDLRLASLQEEAATWQARAESAERELSAVKQRAWALMEEKDAQLQAAKAHQHASMAAEEPLLPVSHTSSAEGLHLQTDGAAQLPLPPGLEQPSAGPPAATAAAEDAGEQDVAALQRRISLLEQELLDSENTHRLRDQAQAVAKQEIADLRRQAKREGLDVNYLKNVILGAFESGELPPKSSMLPVLARLLEFSPAELERVTTRRKKMRV